MPRPPLVVVKVGGSLYDMPDLRIRLRAWLESFSDCVVCIVPGGGKTADVVRDWHKTHDLGEEKAHWLALRSLSFNAHWLAELLPGSAVVSDLSELAIHQEPFLAVLDAFAFALTDERRPDHLPHIWEATSDSVAARVAVVFGADDLYLLKSVNIYQPEAQARDALHQPEAQARGTEHKRGTTRSFAERKPTLKDKDKRAFALRKTTLPEPHQPEPTTWTDATKAGHVDSIFSSIVAQSPSLRIHVINFRL